MTAKILDGNALSATLREALCSRASELTMQGCQPGLAVILVGSDPASQVYVRNKIKACETVGMISEQYEYPADTRPEVVFHRIAALNNDPSIHGILVQLP
ncbi:MAG: bifunctional methylenetetrahydrofolate dehydrogenase/methenyltetrahydrofolate cyclohydrolase, partial [Proteobacteria bacterium]|nr:bifunctional methylenetetrahydrofolate dehydrogenase/methenyltetrahydrofolate cyclohydrolase [Pseudomonadota bacterium]